MSQETSRRNFIHGGALATAGLLTGAAAHAGQPPDKEPHKHDAQGTESFPRDRPSSGGPVGSATDRGKLVPGRRAASEPPVPVEAPDLTRLFWEMKDGVKEFHLYCRHTRREFLPNMWFDVWGYNDSMPGPTIEAVEGDRVRIVVHNELPEATIMHWHGLEVPIRFDGVEAVTQDPILPGETFAYEFTLHQNGTFFYHSHGPMQEAIGMVGLFIIYPRQTHEPAVDRDFALILQEWAILPMSSVPNTMSMEFNFFTMNGRSGPYGTPLVCQLGDRVRIRFVNFSTIDHHPMHLHGHTFWVTGTEGGRIPETAWIPGNNVLVGVAQVREVEFIANNPGDWVIHCHMFHHMMNHMVSMVGPMPMHDDMEMGGKGMGIRGKTPSIFAFERPAGGDMSNSLGMITRGPALSDEHGAHMGRGMGEQTGSEREVRNGPGPKGFLGPGPVKAGEKHQGHDMKSMEKMPAMPGMEHGGHDGMGTGDKLVPGYPQDMLGMAMLSPEEIKRLQKPETRGMRAEWYNGVMGLMTVVRVLPPDLYEKVMSGEGEVKPGASVPGSSPGKVKGHDHEKMEKGK